MDNYILDYLLEHENKKGSKKILNLLINSNSIILTDILTDILIVSKLLKKQSLVKDKVYAEFLNVTILSFRVIICERVKGIRACRNEFIINFFNKSCQLSCLNKKTIMIILDNIFSDVVETYEYEILVENDILAIKKLVEGLQKCN